ncbi:hypothetical protein COT75_04910 [Candidatus Beckwithbacteria bacterium CG10_big_fil_rev_8_21_14_0_10_34_10]|uniref:5'-3' exonuclease domain-containing protein n=1 Tax=Candidatus Beckwithbacteria bacterium CG10_big_fil_rev_8_21_14_0_10_34_10 TaxID=1974495 RepID=A0A2H0W7Z5_9BACT|nr:MAG: hypothetical protein COT75_04910 [Candidatus Beckwithbacteria bacterium CG10_big_fil_rev_8_21_14_0_10_34_10]
MERLLLIDAHAILHRAYHAFPKTLKTKKGELTNAVYGFTSIILTGFKQLKPKYAAIAFDLPKPTFRHRKFKGYKAKRPKTDEELINQIPRAYEIIKVLNIPFFVKEGYEADDIIGTLAKKAGQNKKIEVVILTGDRDALQLIDNKIKVFLPGRGKRPSLMFDKKAFLNQYLFEPRRLIDYKALAGDSSDNIPGVRGVGPKTATNLITKYGSLKEIYNNLERIEEKVRIKLIKEKKIAFLSYDLAEIQINLNLKLDFKKSILKDYNQTKTISLFEELEFKSLIYRLPGYIKQEKEIINIKKDPNKQMGLF